MAQTEQYVKMMLDSLRKKAKLLDAIEKQNEVQSKLAAEAELDIEKFSESVEEKQQSIDELQKLDDGFQALYDRVKQELNGRKELYAGEIRQMQTLIRQLGEQGIRIQGQEEKNRLSLEGHFSRMKKEVRVAKKSVKVASDYYKSMSKLNIVDSQFMDQKK